MIAEDRIHFYSGELYKILQLFKWKYSMYNAKTKSGFSLEGNAFKRCQFEMHLNAVHWQTQVLLQYTGVASWRIERSER